MDNSFLEAGQVVNTHGLKGYIKVVAWTDNSLSFEEFDYIYIGMRKIIIEDVKFQKQNVLLKLKGIDCEEDAQKLKGEIIYCQREQIKLSESRYFITDLIDCSVMDDKKNRVGVVKNVFPTGSNDVYEILTTDHRLIYLPAIKDVITSININDKVISVKSMDGLEL